MKRRHTGPIGYLSLAVPHKGSVVGGYLLGSFNLNAKELPAIKCL